MAVPTKKEIMDFSPINTGNAEELPTYKRNAFKEIKKAMDSKLIIAITGLRRVGKTTLVKQILGCNAFYFSFDEKRYANPDALKSIIDVFLSEMEKPIIFLDEVFRVEDWAGIIKKYHDQKKARFIVSGSSSLMIRKGVESLSGRMHTYYLPPLQFDEHLDLIGKHYNKVGIKDVFTLKGRYQEEVERFLRIGSFPEIVRKEQRDGEAYIRTSTIEKIVFDDIPLVFRIAHPSKLYDLLRLCATNSSRLFTEVNFAEASQLSRHAVSDYLFYLQNAYLVESIYPVGSFQKALKKQKKIFVKTASIYNAFAENPTIGQAVETSVYDKLSNKKLAFYRDGQQREVDFVVDVPIEVKYQSSITSGDIRNLLYYLKKRKAERGILVTKDLFDEKKVDGKIITYVPLDIFLILS
ncbi:MAG: ATP-binding protein [Candidatus Micrarchaeota archaeon]